jgi:hypothetical protein
VCYWSEASKERVDPAGIFYFWRGERPRHPNAPQLEAKDKSVGEMVAEISKPPQGPRQL